MRNVRNFLVELPNSRLVAQLTVERERGLDVRQSILQAGVALLKEHGIATLTQPKVAKAAGVKQSHLTYYFPRRSDLLLGIAQHSIENVMLDLSARLERGPSPEELVRTVATAVVEGVPPRIMIGLIVAADADPALRRPLRKLIKHVRLRIRGILDQAGASAGGHAALLFHATVVGLAVMHHARRTDESAHEIEHGIAAMLGLLGLASKKRSRRTIQ
jgi:AcrR family transcriptional regulator